MLSLPRDASCSPPACASRISVNSTCLADPQCLCADYDTVWAVYYCLYDICSLIDLTAARTALLLQCQAVAVEGAPSIVPSLPASATSTVHLSTITSTTAISSTTHPFPTVQSSTALHTPTTEFAQSSTTPSRSSLTGPSSSEGSYSQPMPVSPTSLAHTSSSSPLATTTPGALAEGAHSPQTHGLSTSIIIPLAVGLGVGIVLAALGVIYLRRRQRQRSLTRSRPQTLQAGGVPPEDSRPPTIRSSVRHRPPTLWLSQSNFARDGSRLSDLEDNEADDSALVFLPTRPSKASDTRHRATRNPEAVWNRTPITGVIPLPYSLEPPSYSSQMGEGPRGAAPAGPSTRIRRSFVERLLSSIGLAPASAIGNGAAARKHVVEPLPAYEASREGIRL